MQETSSQTLSQIVTGNHRAAAVFEKYNLDFCCRGKRSLQQACEEKNISIEQVMGELETASIPGNGFAMGIAFDKLPLSVLAEYIQQTHHAYVKKEMPVIINYLHKIVSKHGERFPQMRRVLAAFTALKEEMDLHMEKEEVVLFPRIREIEKLGQERTENKLSLSYLLSPINMMEQEHEHAGALLEEIRDLTNNYNPAGEICTTFRVCLDSLHAFETDLHQHVHLENNILFPGAIRLFRSSMLVSMN
jgi:regulator of cell morphogenesis and NO signaling